MSLKPHSIIYHTSLAKPQIMFKHFTFLVQIGIQWLFLVRESKTIMDAVIIP